MECLICKNSGKVNLSYDDNCYLKLRKNLFKRRNIRSYKNVAMEFLDIINEH